MSGAGAANGYGVGKNDIWLLTDLRCCVRRVLGATLRTFRFHSAAVYG